MHNEHTDKCHANISPANTNLILQSAAQCTTFDFRKSCIFVCLFLCFFAVDVSFSVNKNYPKNQSKPLQSELNPFANRNWHFFFHPSNMPMCNDQAHFIIRMANIENGLLCGNVSWKCICEIIWTKQKRKKNCTEKNSMKNVYIVLVAC